MARNSVVPPESFREILAWLHSDEEVAASMYLELRNELEKKFVQAGCSDPKWLTDETIDRVSRKVHELRPIYTGDPKSYFFGVAKNLIKEDAKKIKTHASLEDVHPLPAPEPEIEEETAAMREECLHACLQTLSAETRKLIINYYAKEKQAKIDHRAALARDLGMKVETLRVKVHRIREALEKCIEQCLDQKAERK